MERNKKIMTKGKYSSNGRRDMFPKPCSAPGCRQTAHGRYCKAHQHLEHRNPYEQSRGSAYRRGYDGRWQKARKAFLEENPLCVICLEEGYVTTATVVDHILPHKGYWDVFWDMSNWQALCKSCHDRKTATEDMGGWDTKKGLR